tara:strand:+ start:684 stop:977 length:294 start_codon:yes stop_codon:yes gene_type:complete
MEILESIGYWAGYCYSLIFVSSYVPQLIKVVRTKRVDDLSLNMFVLTTIGYICLFMYQFYIGFKIALVFNCLVGGAFSIFIMCAILRYRLISKPPVD